MWVWKCELLQGVLLRVTLLLQYQRKTLLKEAASQAQPLKQTQPAPLKTSVSRVAQQQQMSLYADKKMTTRQSSQRPAGKAKQVRALRAMTLQLAHGCVDTSPYTNHRQAVSHTISHTSLPLVQHQQCLASGSKAASACLRYLHISALQWSVQCL